MSELTKPEDEQEREPAQGKTNLVLLYSLLALALVAAIVFAVLVVKPFYLRR
jgi:hypothetical protein